MNVSTILSNLTGEASIIAGHYLDSETTKISTIADIIERKYEENYVLVCVMHKMVHKDHDKQEEPANVFSKKAKKAYNRIYQLGDINGQTCCIISESQEVAKRLINLLVDTSAIGRCFVLFEPTVRSGQSLRQDMPVFEINTTMLPLNDGFINNFPMAVPKAPTLANETTFFVLHGLKLRWVQTEVRGKGDIFPPSCPSYLCDRKEPQKVTNACGCFSHSLRGNLSPVVLEGTIISDDTSSGSDKMFTVIRDRSFKTTLMFIESPDSLGISQHTDRLISTKGIRKSVEKCYKYINTNGGFTVCGSITRGEIQDASEAMAKIASEQTNYHICYSQPTQLSVLKDPEYKKLKFNYSVPVPGTRAATRRPVNVAQGTTPNISDTSPP